MKTATVIYLIRDNKEVLLPWKTRKVGAGKRNGYGGKQDEGESLRACTVRELFDESGAGIVVKEEDLIPRARISFFNPGNDEEIPNFDVVFYVAHEFSGEASSTNEMSEPKWFPLHDVPYNDMMVGDHLFVPRILRGECLTGTLHFTEGFTDVAKYNFVPADESSLEI